MPGQKRALANPRWDLGDTVGSRPIPSPGGGRRRKRDCVYNTGGGGLSRPGCTP